MMRLLISLTLVLGALFGGYTFLNQAMDVNFKTSHVVKVQQGEGLFQVLGKLNSLEPFNLRAAKLHSKLFGSYQIKPGEYRIDPGKPLYSLLQDMHQGKVALYKVVIPEGYNLFETADLLTKKGFVPSPEAFLKEVFSEDKNLEGQLFPSTYKFAKNTPVAILVERFKQVHTQVLDDLLKIYPLPQGYTRHQIVTLASIVEKETGAAWERPLIASVFWNRLKKGMRLQSDPTTIYGKWVQTGKRLKDIKKSHLLESTPYNTYAIKALPLGPISNPGKKALEAVLNPKKSNYLYFVSQNDGTHYFSKTYKEHQAAVKRYQLSRSARAGKSWRDLSSRK